jgi:hypothetical protein
MSGASYLNSNSGMCPPPPPNQRGGGHTRLRVTGPNSDDWRKAWHFVYSVGFRIHPRSSYIFCRRCFRVMFRIKMLIFRNHAVKISMSYLSYLCGAFVPAEPSLKLSSYLIYRNINKNNGYLTKLHHEFYGNV